MCEVVGPPRHEQQRGRWERRRQVPGAGPFPRMSVCMLSEPLKKEGHGVKIQEGLGAREQGSCF